MTLPESPELSIHQLAEIRSAILAALDGGDPKRAIGNTNFGWNFNALDDNYANAQRLDFCDMVQSILTARLKGNV